jgi:hypothetical protein
MQSKRNGVKSNSDRGVYVSFFLLLEMNQKKRGKEKSTHGWGWLGLGSRMGRGWDGVEDVMLLECIQKPYLHLKMEMDKLPLCAPALIYIAFSLAQILIDTFSGNYPTAFFKVIVMVVITALLQLLCSSGMSIISWFIVFIPFLFMSVIVGILLWVFGFDPETNEVTVIQEGDGKGTGVVSVAGTGLKPVVHRPPIYPLRIASATEVDGVYIIHGNVVRPEEVA